MDPNRTRQIIEYILLVASQKGYELGEIHVLKYVYLADLAYARTHGGQTYTGCRWKFHTFGPWCLPLQQGIRPAAERLGADIRSYSSDRFEKDVTRYRAYSPKHLDRLELDIPHEVCSMVKRSIHDHGSDTADLLDHVYKTRPMLHAAPGDDLDFTTDAHESQQHSRTDSSHASSLTDRQKKKRREKLQELRRRIQQTLANPPSQRVLVKPKTEPRYDEVFAELNRWTDADAGDEIETGEGTVVVDETVWRSRSRSDELP